MKLFVSILRRPFITASGPNNQIDGNRAWVYPSNLRIQWSDGYHRVGVESLIQDSEP